MLWGDVLPAIVVGHGGSMPLWFQAEGRPYEAEINLLPNTDRFVDSVLEFNDGNLTNPQTFVVCAADDRSNAVIRHTVQRANLNGAYKKNGWLTFKAKIVVSDSSGPELGYMCLNIPINIAWAYNRGILGIERGCEQWGSFNAKLAYVRLPALRAPEIIIKSSQPSIYPEETTNVTVVLNNKGAFDLEKAEVQLKMPSLGEVLECVGECSAHMGRVPAQGGSASVDYVLKGKEAGRAIPCFDIDYWYDDPVPESHSKRTLKDLELC
jgi:hypothetical protein